MYAIWDKEANSWYVDEFFHELYLKSQRKVPCLPVFQYEKDAVEYVKEFDKPRSFRVFKVSDMLGSFQPVKQGGRR